MPLGALTDIEHARGSSPRLTARVAAEGQAMRPGGGGVAGFLVAGGAPKGSEAASWSRRAARWPSLGSDETRGRSFTAPPSRPATQRTAPGGFGLPAHDRDAKGARPPQG